MILLYADKITARLEYAARLIFQDILTTKVQFTDQVILFKDSPLPKINYSPLRFGDEPFISAGNLLFCETIEVPEIQSVEYEGETGFFPTSPDSVLPFDPFASAFLIVTRMEEYLPGPRDSYGRYIAENSILYRFGLLEKPVVNRWAWLLASLLRQKYRQLVFVKPSFRFLSTIDVDNAYAYLHKGLWRTSGSLIKKLVKGKFAEFFAHTQVILQKSPDPFDTYSYIYRQFKGLEENVRFFFLLHGRGKYDRQVSPQNRHFRKLVFDVSQKFRTGLHPSFLSSRKRSPAMIREEKKQLEDIISREVKLSRQHYLMIEFPFTFRNLLESEIIEDYSMGFAGLPGFRAGICTPFYLYDLLKDEATPLKMFPFQVMDVTLRQYLRLTPEDAILKIDALIEEVKAVGGIFCSIWHNESLGEKDGWKGYREVFENMNQLGFYYASGKE